MHRLGSRIRNSHALREQKWFWKTVEPAWEKCFARLSRTRGYAAMVNGDAFRLEYSYASRYDRQDRRAYEPVFYGAFVEQVQSGMTVLDIGAHIGIFTLGAARRAGERGRVYAFEPSPKTARTLQRHVEMNRCQKQVEVVTQVVSDVDGEISFYARGESTAASLSRENVEVLSPDRSDGPARVVVTRSVTLDKFCGGRGIRPDVMKIDVEGAELRVLRGARKILQEGAVQVLCEVHSEPMLKNCGGSREELLAFLKEIGYRWERLDEPNWMDIYHCRIIPDRREDSRAART